MRTIARLFGKSPFLLLRGHMERVARCVEQLHPLFRHLGNGEEVERLAAHISDLEHAADITKNDIRNHLPRSLFLPIDRSHVLEILSAQDRIADQAEALALAATLRTLNLPHDLSGPLHDLIDQGLSVFQSTLQIVEEIDTLLEASFGGLGAERVKELVAATALLEHETRLKKHLLERKVFAHSANLATPDFILICQLIEGVGEFAHRCENLANRIRMTLESP